MAEVADAALEILCRATAADAGLVTSMDETYEATAARNVDPRTIDVILSFGELGGPLARALEPPEAVIAADVATGPLREDVRQALIHDGIKRMIVVGLRVSGRLTGLLALGWRHAPATDPSHGVLLQAAALVAGALANARLIAAVETGLAAERLLNRRMAGVVELTRLPAATPVGGPSAERATATVRTVVGADAAAMATVRDGSATIVATDGIDARLLAPLVTAAPDGTTILDRLGNASSLLLALELRANAAAAALVEAGFRSVAAFAVRDDDAVVAVLLAAFRGEVTTLDLDDRTLDAIARVIDISFANERLQAGVDASQRRYRELFEGSPDALVVQSLGGVVLDANPAARRLYGEEVVGRSVDELVVEGSIETLHDRDGVVRHRAIGRRLDGTTFPEEVDVRSIEVDGQDQRLAIVRDQTERARMQAELVQAQKMEAIGLLVAGVAHELNNPLASIIAFSQLIRTDPDLPPDLQSQASLLVEEANRTRTIVGNLLDFARQRQPERHDQPLGPIVESVLGLQSYLLGRSRVRVDVDIPADLPPVAVDRSQIQQVLVNLTVNAIQAIRSTDRPGRIAIHAAAAGGEPPSRVRIAIADDGPGVPGEILDQLFLPFVTTKAPGEGSGLGLSVSYGIVAAHGGTLRHALTPGGGATFVIELPVSEAGGEAAAGAPRDDPGVRGSAFDAEPSPTPAGAAAPDAAPPDAAPSGQRVLILDDEPSIRAFLSRVLTRNGYVPVVASSGTAALDIVRSDPPDAILCDHRMAGMNGTDFHDAVSAIDPVLARRFAFMSGDVLNPELREFATARGVHLLAKPFDISTAAEIVRELLAGETP
ncbi:MAG TPA: ATP-binding protein [Candidatus Limnocylindrales bacterium]|nr:ATP-binding protein [Candidatus Limnocylindrales bacterium]